MQTVQESFGCDHKPWSPLLCVCAYREITRFKDPVGRVKSSVDYENLTSE